MSIPPLTPPQHPPDQALTSSISTTPRPNRVLRIFMGCGCLAVLTFIAILFFAFRSLEKAGSFVKEGEITYSTATFKVKSGWYGYQSPTQLMLIDIGAIISGNQYQEQHAVLVVKSLGTNFAREIHAQAIEQEFTKSNLEVRGSYDAVIGGFPGMCWDLHDKDDQDLKTCLAEGKPVVFAWTSGKQRFPEFEQFLKDVRFEAPPQQQSTPPEAPAGESDNGTEHPKAD